GAEQEHVLPRVLDALEADVGVGGEGEHAGVRQRGECLVDVGMDAHVREIVVVQPGPAELGVLEVEAKGLDEMEAGAGDGGETDRIAGVPGDRRLMEEDVDHGADSPTRLLPRGLARQSARDGEEPRSTRWIGARIACPRGDLNPAEGFGDLLIRRLTCGNATCSYDQLPPVSEPCVSKMCPRNSG